MAESTPLIRKHQIVLSDDAYEFLAKSLCLAFATCIHDPRLVLESVKWLLDRYNTPEMDELLDELCTQITTERLSR